MEGTLGLMGNCENTSLGVSHDGGSVRHPVAHIRGLLQELICGMNESHLSQAARSRINPVIVHSHVMDSIDKCESIQHSLRQYNPLQTKLD